MRARKLPIALIALFGALALVGAGCGGGGDDTTAPVETTAEAKQQISKLELLSQGDAICAEVNAAVGAIGAGEGDTQEQTTEAAGLYTSMIESILELGAPDDPEGYSEFVTAAEELGKVEGEVKLASERADTVALGEAATAAVPALEEFQAQAAIYGFEECSEGPSAPTIGAGAAGGEVEEGGIEAAPEIEEEVIPEEEVAPEEIAPETGGAGGGIEEGVAPESGGESGSSGGVGPG